MEKRSGREHMKSQPCDTGSETTEGKVRVQSAETTMPRDFYLDILCTELGSYIHNTTHTYNYFSLLLGKPAKEY